tara:strand:+ start:12069 stop:12275 length:207 start_codon:yes stop_codon:yes gene_type:complete
MVPSIFSNLPHNLIMDIVKIESERKYREEKKRTRRLQRMTCLELKRKFNFYEDYAHFETFLKFHKDAY